MDAAPGERGPRALVVGAGIGGLAAAVSLHRAGWRVVVCERAPARRTGGYFVRLTPEGVAAAGRLGVATGLRTRLPADGVIRGVDGRGRTTSLVETAVVDDGAGMALVRGDLERVLWAARPDAVEVRFGTGPRSLTQDAGGVHVALGEGGTERFDLVVGADGIHSTVRGLVFGPEERFRHDFDHVVVSAVLPRLPAGLAEGDYVVLAEPGRSAHLMAMRGHDPVVFFTFRADRPELGAAPADAPRAALRAVYGGFGGLMPDVLDGVDEAGTTHADTVGQIHLERWSRGRVVLLGDAAWCPTLYSGHGSALALTGGESLGRHLAGVAARDVPAALASWERAQRPGAESARTAARRARPFFLPGNRTVAVLRRAALRFASWTPAGRALQAFALLTQGGRGHPARAEVHSTATSPSGSGRACPP